MFDINDNVCRECKCCTCEFRDAVECFYYPAICAECDNECSLNECSQYTKIDQREEASK